MGKRGGRGARINIRGAKADARQRAGAGQEERRRREEEWPTGGEKNKSQHASCSLLRRLRLLRSAHECNGVSDERPAMVARQHHVIRGLELVHTMRTG